MAINWEKMSRLYAIAKDKKAPLEKRAEAVREYNKRLGFNVMGSDYAIVNNF